MPFAEAVLCVLAGAGVLGGALSGRLVKEEFGRARALTYAGAMILAFLAIGTVLWVSESFPLGRAMSAFGCLLGVAGAVYLVFAVLRQPVRPTTSPRGKHSFTALVALALGFVLLDGVTVLFLLRGSDAVRIVSLVANLAANTVLVLAWNRLDWHRPRVAG